MTNRLPGTHESLGETYPAQMPRHNLRLHAGCLKLPPMAFWGASAKAYKLAAKDQATYEESGKTKEKKLPRKNQHMLTTN